MKPSESTAPSPSRSLTFRMEALKVALLLVLALGVFVDSTFGAVITKDNEISSDIDGQARAKRSPRKNAPKKPTVRQPAMPKQDFRSDCMTPALELIQSCCPVPLLITRESQTRCNDGEKRLKMGIFHTIREAYINPLTSGKTRIANVKDFKVVAQHFVGGPMCFIECAMKDMKWVGEDGRIDVTAIEAQVVGNLKKRTYNAPWVPIATKAIQTCVQEVENLPLQQIQNARGKQCNTQPGTYMNCVRKKLIMECPATQFSDSYGCRKAKLQLEKCSPLEVLKAINSGQPLPDTIGQDGMGTNGMDGNMGGNGMDGNMGGGGMEGQPAPMPGGEQTQQPPPETPPPDTPPPETPPPEQPQEQTPPPPPEEAAPPPPEPAAEPPAEPAAEPPAEPAAEPPAEPAAEPPADEPQPAAEEAPPPEEAQPAAEEPPAEEPPAEEPPAEE